MGKVPKSNAWSEAVSEVEREEQACDILALLHQRAIDALAPSEGSDCGLLWWGGEGKGSSAEGDGAMQLHNTDPTGGHRSARLV